MARTKQEKKTLRDHMNDARNREWDKMSEKALARARKRGNSFAMMTVSTQANAEALVSRGWEILQAHGQQTIWDINQRYTLRKRVLGH